MSARTRQQVNETLAQMELWAGASQSTLITSPPEENLNASKNFEIARSVARDTLFLAENIQDTSDDLLLLLDLVSDEIVATQSGISKTWGADSFKSIPILQTVPRKCTHRHSSQTGSLLISFLRRVKQAE